ncbi:unnamed protein product [Phytophthora fragariaefolia]|uniref:Unnamed protein product n=1 Tax=Phytophthora fragariaefolia TaxID=1490495 RepID=A0A9W7DAA4_9STRA|nr:unnamed protein product [Phytophthora fragariaefolia]
MTINDSQGAPHRLRDPFKHSQKPKLTSACKGIFMLVLTTVLLIVVVGVDIVLETNILTHTLDSALRSSQEEQRSVREDVACSPIMANASSIDYHSRHRYYSLMKEASSLSPHPVFRGNHMVLCSSNLQSDLSYEYCLPISGRKDSPFCAGADRMDLLAQHSREIRCYASVLHMLLVEVYEELQHFSHTPIVVFGSLLGAVRNGSMIPFTEDTDIAYSGQLNESEIGRALKEKGYHFFFLHIWRVCVASTHPLAAKLYDSSLPITEAYKVPYLDLYAMKKQNETTWSMEEFSDGTLPADKVQPFSQVKINGLSFDTVHDPNYFLERMYGEQYMVPRPRD